MPVVAGDVGPVAFETDWLDWLHRRHPGREMGAPRRWVWNSPPELGQDMASTTTGGMAWTAPRF